MSSRPDCIRCCFTVCALPLACVCCAELERMQEMQQSMLDFSLLNQEFTSQLPPLAEVMRKVGLPTACGRGAGGM